MREPDIAGVTGQAWKASPPAELQNRWPAGLDMWLLRVPHAHPLWSFYVVTACSLRDFPGVPPAKKRFSEATHEMSVIALAPEFVATDDWCSSTDDRWAKHILTPLNLSEQVADFTDEKANELCFLFARAFCVGHANPDDDFRTWNKRIFAETVDHLRRGLHEVH